MFLVYCSLLCFQLFSFLYRFSPIPPTPTKFHHHLNAWIQSTSDTPGSRPLSPSFGGATHCGFHAKYPLKLQQNEHWMTCCPLWVPQPTPSILNLLLMAWTCWTHDLHSWFTSLLFQEGENRHKFQPSFEAHQPHIPWSTLQGLRSFASQTMQRPHTKFSLH